METVHVRTRSDANGILHLDIPVGKQDVEFEITLVLELTDNNGDYSSIIDDDGEGEDLDELLCD